MHAWIWFLTAVVAANILCVRGHFVLSCEELSESSQMPQKLRKYRSWVWWKSWFKSKGIQLDREADDVCIINSSSTVISMTIMEQLVLLFNHLVFSTSFLALCPFSTYIWYHVSSYRPKSTPTPTASLSANGVPTETVDYDRLKQVWKHLESCFTHFKVNAYFYLFSTTWSLLNFTHLW